MIFCGAERGNLAHLLPKGATGMFAFVDAIAATPRRRSAFRHQSGKPKRTTTTDFTIEAPALIEALNSVVGLDGPVLEPAAGKGHMAVALRTRGLTVVASDLNVYENPLILDIERKDLREIISLEGFAWTITNLPYSPHRYHDELATHLIELAVAAHCGVALLVRNDASTAGGRQRLLHGCSTFAGKLEVWRPYWVEKTPGEKVVAPQHPFAWLVWSPEPRRDGEPPWLAYRGKASARAAPSFRSRS